MSDKITTVRIPPDLRDAIDAVRGDVPRERWVRTALAGLIRDPQPGPAWDRPTAAYIRGLQKGSDTRSDGGGLPDHRNVRAEGRDVELALGGEPKVRAQGPKESPDSGAKPRSSAPTEPPARARPPHLGQLFIPRAIPPCPDCGKANGVHRGDCPAHPGRKR